MVIKAPGQSALSIGPVQESLVKLGIPPAHDGAVSAPAVELSQDVEQRRGCVYRPTGDFVGSGSGLRVFHLPREEPGEQGLRLPFSLRLQDNGAFDDTLPLHLKPRSFPIA